MICSVKAQSLASGQVSEVIAISRNGGPTEQIQDLQNLISQGVDAIIINPSDREQLNPVIEEAIAQGIVVVAVDQAVTAEGAYVATNDQVEYGRLGAQWLADDLGGEGSVLYMRGIEGVPADEDRHAGFSEVMEQYPDIEIKEVFTGWDYTEGGDIAVQELTAADYDAHLDVGHRLHGRQRLRNRRQGAGPGHRRRQQRVHQPAAQRSARCARDQPRRDRRRRHADRPRRPHRRRARAGDHADAADLGPREQPGRARGQLLPRP